MIMFRTVIVIVVVILSRSGDRCNLLCRSFEITALIKNLLPLVGSTILAGRVRNKRSLAGGAQTNRLWLHRVVRTAASNAGS